MVSANLMLVSGECQYSNTGALLLILGLYFLTSILLIIEIEKRIKLENILKYKGGLNKHGRK